MENNSANLTLTPSSDKLDDYKTADVINKLKQAGEAYRVLDQKLTYLMGLSGLFDWKFYIASGLFTFSDRYFLSTAPPRRWKATT